jgi:soluble lytic murein transglycosylase-like protein
MQVQKISHRERMNKLGVSDLYDIDSNVHVATDYLAELFEQYEDVGTVLMVYHGEKDAVLKSERGEVSKYAREILERSYALETAHGKHDLKVR